jgi:conjugal transfer pilus assembly protein TraV
MSRFVYSMLGQPVWVVGSYLVEPAGKAPNPPVLRSVRDAGTEAGAGVP